jgi:DNA-binding ferritin-like protein (Dps family)
MSSLWTKVIGDKKEWRSMEARAAALPDDSRIVYREMKQYMFRFTSGDGMDVVAVLKDVLGLFENGAAEGTHALDVTGEDVAAFCDQRLRATPSFADRWRTSLNRDVANQLGHAGSHG